MLSKRSFQDFLKPPLGEMIQFDLHVFNGLKPPTSFDLVGFHEQFLSLGGEIFSFLSLKNYKKFRFVMFGCKNLHRFFASVSHFCARRRQAGRVSSVLSVFLGGRGGGAIKCYNYSFSAQNYLSTSFGM